MSNTQQQIETAYLTGLQGTVEWAEKLTRLHKVTKVVMQDPDNFGSALVLDHRKFLVEQPSLVQTMLDITNAGAPESSWWNAEDLSFARIYNAREGPLIETIFGDIDKRSIAIDYQTVTDIIIQGLVKRERVRNKKLQELIEELK